LKTINIHIKGLVQGVGFRPFIYRIAARNGITGWVDNRNDGVYICAQGDVEKIEAFVQSIKKEAPLASKIVSMNISDVDAENFTEFTIVKSKNTSDAITDVSPDIAVCPDCLADMKVQKNRINYPFINCTNCGPRFTIIKDLPYDREKTTMLPFVMCDDCRKEYTDILDRRFHAQPVACEVCGPSYILHDNKSEITDFKSILNHTANLLNEGKIVAIKGIGGYFIACDASNEHAVNRLRKNKIRESKPFAVMFRNIEKVKEYTFVSQTEQEQISSWQRPIILLKKKKDFAQSVCLGFNTIGCMLPYMPVHYLLFEKLRTDAIVLTSGNISDEPIVIDDKTAREKLGKICDAVLSYNREIYNRTDDSVVFAVNDKPRLIRRSRGFVPGPFTFNFSVDGIIATGAELVNCFCVGKDHQAIMSQHIGDLKNMETLEFFSESLERFKKLFRVEPKVMVCDLHPDYLSTRYAKETGLKIIEVQHHHAHIASCMAEHGLDEKVIGVAMDGTGLGDDGNIWGAEFMVCDYENYQRKTHFEYIPMPGGDKATKESWRMGVSFLYKAYGQDFLKKDIPFVKQLDHEKTALLLQAIDKKINCPLSSSAGRLFDAVSAIINLCTHADFHAEAPMRLEAIIEPGVKEKYNYEVADDISFIKTIKEIVADLEKKIPIGIISAKFHNTIITVIIETAEKIRKESGINKICLSGGTFQNRYLLENVEKELNKLHFEVYSNEQVPSNDGGIALGQMVVGKNSIY